MADDGLKLLVKLLFGCLLWAAFICYSNLFIFDYVFHSATGWIFMYVFMIIFTIVGFVAIFMDNLIVSVVFCVCYAVCIITHACYAKVLYAICVGALALTFGIAFTIALFFGGGK